MKFLFQLLLQLLLIALNAVFACAEIAVLSVSDVKITHMVQEGTRRERRAAGRLAKFKAKPARFLATIQVAITLAGFLGSAFAANNFADDITAWLAPKMGVDAGVIQTVTVIVITLILSFITLIFGELVPKRLAMKNSEGVALHLSGLISFVAKIFAPLVWLLTVCTNGILRLLQVDPNETGEDVSEEEIRMMVDVGTEKGVIDEEEQEMIQNVFEFDDMTAGEFATHRTDMVILWLDEDNETWKKRIHETRHSFFPVCGESADDMVGVLNAKDFFRLADAGREAVMKGAVSGVYLVPETIKADMLFRQMKETRNRFAVVLDEYGGVFGIVTMNDIIEQIVGGFEAESIEEEEEELVPLGNDCWRIKGSASLHDVEEKLEVKFGEQGEAYDTFGGLVFGVWGTIPADGTVFSVDLDENVRVDVEEIREHRIESAKVTVTRSNPEDEDEKEADGT